MKREETEWAEEEYTRVRVESGSVSHHSNQDLFKSNQHNTEQRSAHNSPSYITSGVMHHLSLIMSSMQHN